MKVFEIVQDDEFANTEFTISNDMVKHLYKVQKARCYEFIRYLQYLGKKYPNWYPDSGFFDIQQLVSWTVVSTTWFLNSSVAALPPEISKLDEFKYTDKYTRVKDAKIAYEHAGGKY